MDREQLLNPLNRFGGWLSFFYITLWISLIIGIGITLIFLVASLGALENLIFCFHYGISVFLIFKIIRILRTQDETTPNRVVKLMLWFTLLALLFTILEMRLDYLLKNGKNAADISKGVLNSSILVLAWVTYFRKSKRVLAYYGKNCDIRWRWFVKQHQNLKM